MLRRTTLLTLALTAAAAGQAAIEPPRRLIVAIERDPLPDRAARLGRLRALIRAGADAADYESEVDALADASRAALAAHRAAVIAAGGRVRRTYWSFPGFEVEIPRRAAPALARALPDARVFESAVHPAHIYEATNANNHDADFVQSQLGLDGAGATLALLDSGIDVDCATTGRPHPAFDYPSHTEASRILDAFGIANPGEFEDRTGHGTAVAGIAVAVDWGSTGLPSDSGFAPGANLVSYKVTAPRQDTYRDADLLAAIDAVLRDAVRYRIRVVNFSFAGTSSPTSPTQRALDRLATVGDILAVTSAGNDRQAPNPTARSNSNANGIAVAAVHKDTHRVAKFSTPGPLLGDPERLWPDISAVGVSLVAPMPDSLHGTSLPQTGTSFAAPAVAGTALVLRGARPDLSSIDTKAILLNNVADLSEQNPGLNHFHYGVGLLRTDLAALALTEGQLHRGVVTRAAPAASVTVQVALGAPYAATLAWLRTNLASARWDDLDLEVVDTDGRVLARSKTRRNLYERVMFTARHTGTYKLRVRGSALARDSVGWSLAFGPNRGGGRQAGEHESFGAGGLGSGADPAQGIEVPAFARGRFGDSRSELPLASAPVRVMQAIDAASIPGQFKIDRIAFRRDEIDWGTPTFLAHVEVFAGHTSRRPNELSATFADNPDQMGMTRVLFQRALVLPGTRRLAGNPGVYEYVLPLDRPFVAAGSGSGRNLLLEFRVRGHSNGSMEFGLRFDAELDATRLGIVHAIGDPDAPVGVVEPFGLAMSLISGESGGIAPTLVADRLPQLGARFDVVLRNAPARTVATLVHGTRRDAWGSWTLPLSLAPFGAPGNSLYASPDVLLPVIVDAAGQGLFEYSLPNLPSLTGSEFFNQFIVLDPAANPLGLTTSAAAAAQVGG